MLFKDSENPLLNFDVHANAYNNDQADYILNSPITDDEIKTSISKLKRGKSPGKDGIGAEFYINTKHVITPILNVLFNKILSSGSFPDAWSESIIVPLYKSGSRSDPSNYRGISLVDVMYKLFAGIINNRLTRF